MFPDSNTDVSVLMCVHNGQRFLREAVESILAQTFPNFEVVIIDDGSTDRSLDILRSIKDSRVLMIPQPHAGVASALNYGLELSSGQYIARMDADDISLPDRLEKQVAWLREHPDYCAVGAKVMCIDENGDPAPDWAADQCTVTHDDICRTLPRANCIAHPSVMIRADVLGRYLYNPAQAHSQDYDLWLRMVSDGLKIAKIDEPLVKLRVHPASVTARTLERLGADKNRQVKGIYLQERILGSKKLTLFDLRVMKEFMRDCFTIKH